MLNHADGRWSLKMFHQEEPEARRGVGSRAHEGGPAGNGEGDGGQPPAESQWGPTICGEAAICWQIFINV